MYRDRLLMVFQRAGLRLMGARYRRRTVRGVHRDSATGRRMNDRGRRR